MIFQFRMLCDEDDYFLREYEVPYDMTLAAFRDFINKDLQYRPEELTSFFTADELWEKLREFTLMDIDDGSEGAPAAMESVTLGQIILSISSMGFLGLGVASPTPEWGTIISENMLNIRYYPYLGLAPGICICLAVMAVNFIGDGLRDAFDPRAGR